ncbi:hypothetical protein ACFL09_05210 [Planctomycetota bacterium]
MSDELPIKKPPDAKKGVDAWREWAGGAIHWLVVQEVKRNDKCAKHGTAISRLKAAVGIVFAVPAIAGGVWFVLKALGVV